MEVSIIFCGLDFFGYSNFNENMICVNNINSVQMASSIVDQISIRKNIDVIYSAIQKTWQYDNIALGDFNGSLELGNLGNKGIPVTSLLYMRKKTTDLVWDAIITIPYLNSQSLYSFKDLYVASNVSMDYALIPCSIGGIQGDWIIATILPSFTGTFIFDDYSNFHLDKDLKWDAITTNISKSTYLPLGSQFPITIYGSTKYRTGKITNTLITDDSMDGLGTGISGIDLANERLQTDAFIDFITNFCPKMLKDGQGKMLCVNTDGNPTETPNNELHGGISDVSFDFTECGKTDIKTLQSMNLGNIIPDDN